MAGKSSKSPAISRRTIFAAAGMSLIGGHPGPPPTTPISSNTVETLCREWLRTDKRLGRLLVAWGDTEAELATRCGWYRLTEPERLTHPGRGSLEAIDRQVDRLVEDRAQLLQILTRARSDGVAGILLKTRVATEVVDRTDCPEGHALIRSILRDLSSAPGVQLKS